MPSTLRGRNQDLPPCFRDQIVRPHGAVRITDTPEALWVAEVAVGDVVQPLGLADEMAQLRSRLLDKSNSLIYNNSPLGIGDLLLAHVGISAAFEEHPSPPVRKATGHECGSRCFRAETARLGPPSAAGR